mgnify:CR=1 FL=1
MYRSYYRRRPIFLAPAMIILYITLILLAMLYFGGVFFFQDKYLPNTTVGNISCGLKDAKYVEDIVSSQVSRYSLLVTDRKGNQLKEKNLITNMYSWAKNNRFWMIKIHFSGQLHYLSQTHTRFPSPYLMMKNS